jgi:hypothetical protein
MICKQTLYRFPNRQLVRTHNKQKPAFKTGKGMHGGSKINQMEKMKIADETYLDGFQNRRVFGDTVNDSRAVPKQVCDFHGRFEAMFGWQVVWLAFGHFG